jgi:hypothetical protein
MAILTKPSVVKGQTATFSLSKADLLQHPMVVADSYFSDPDNWYRVNVVYKSSPGSQYEIVEFDASAITPTGSFLVSTQARDLFLLQKLVILDFDGGFFEIPRSELTISEFDVSLVAAFFTIDFSQNISSISPEFFNGSSVVGGVLDLTSVNSTFRFTLPNPPFPVTGSFRYSIRVHLDSSYEHTLMEGGMVYPLLAFKTYDPLKWAIIDTSQEKLDIGFINSIEPINEDLNANNLVAFAALQGGFRITKIEFFQV